MNPDREVPEWLRPAVGEAVDALPVALIRGLAAGLPGGLTKPDAMRAAWKRTLKGFHHLPDWLAEALRECLAPATVLRMLEAGSIPDLLPLLRGVADRSQLAVALWLDPRPEVHALATPHSGNAPAVGTPASRKPWVEFVEKAFLQRLGCSLKDSASWAEAEAGSAAPQPPADPPRARQELDRLRKHLEDARHRHVREKADLEARNAAEKANAAEQIRKLEAEREDLRKATHRLQADFQQAVHAEADRVLDARLNQWLREAETEEVELRNATPAFEELLRQADQALQRQAEADRRHGNRAQLRRQLQQLRERLEALDQAAVEALDPQPALVRIRERLAEAIRSRELNLGETQRLLGVAGEIAGAINQATSEHRLIEVRKLVTDLANTRTLPADAAARLNELADQRRALLAAPDRVRRPAGARHATTAVHLLGGTGVGVVLVDAYNVLGEAGELLGLSSVPARLPASLNGLLSRLRDFARSRSSLEILVLVDSPKADTRNLASNLRVLYSGGTGANRADAIIEGHLLHLQNQREPRPVVVVSNDAEVRRAAERLGAMPVHPRELALRLTPR